MAEFTADELTELAELLKRNPSPANLDKARRAVKQPRERKAKVRKVQLTERERLLSWIDKTAKRNEELLALRCEHYRMSHPEPGDPAPSIKRDVHIHNDIMLAYVDVNEALRGLLPKVRALIGALSDPEKS
ncbi:MAG: hypothetical protein GJU76_05265 [Gallionella sp.]|jgi:hypothetical protein|nr:hypothetical protein [Gallionella sp.]